MIVIVMHAVNLITILITAQAATTAGILAGTIIIQPRIAVHQAKPGYLAAPYM